MRKIEPPAGDPLATYAPGLYAELSAGMEVVVRDLKTAPCRRAAGRGRRADHVVPRGVAGAARARPGGDRRAPAAVPRRDRRLRGRRHGRRATTSTTRRRPVSSRAPQLPASLYADIAGGERAVFAALALLAERDRTGRGGTTEVALSDAARALAAPLHAGLTPTARCSAARTRSTPSTRRSEGFVAVGCLEPQFADRLAEALGARTADELAAAFGERTADDWERWARAHDLPVNAVR